jgi:hypothetical protein
VALAIFAILVVDQGDTVMAEIVAFFLAVGIAISAGFGATHIEKRYTTIETETVEMVVTKTDVTDDGKFVVVVGKEHVVDVSEAEYAAVNENDVVTVEVDTVTVFNETSYDYRLVLGN